MGSHAPLAITTTMAATDLAVSDGTRVLLFHNEKNGTFKDVTDAAGIHYDQAEHVVGEPDIR